MMKDPLFAIGMYEVRTPTMPRTSAATAMPEVRRSALLAMGWVAVLAVVAIFTPLPTGWDWVFVCA